ncbi:amidohydrolase [Fusobacterium varium]|uniref:amidohydrolase n=1 Tax=Fusobacterium varium TaxID=856 RepID=UPI000E4CD67E|nr:amidohydrolase [Fusobacterium varium]RHG37050.1 amidohydrolase [Fusobacterium varium]
MLSNEMILSAAKEVEEYVKLTRGYLHENPEISGQEFDTSAFLKKEVAALGLPIENVSTTGFIATLKCKNPGKTLALRSDIDALKMSESETNMSGKKKYISKRPEACHSCGHDSHMAMLLGSMKILVKLKDFLSGTIIFCFEEGEETGCGIDKMLEVLSKKNIDAVWGMHITSFMKTGTVSVDPGPRMAGAALINMNIIGRGGHGSRPDLSINPLFGAANVLMSLSSAWVNRIDSNETVTLGLATINGGTAANIIPDKVSITGTIRYFNIEEGKKAFNLIKEVSTYAAKSQNCSIEFAPDMRIAANPTINDTQLSAFAAKHLSEILPEGALILQEKWYASESFNKYSVLCPTLFVFVGAGNEKVGSTAEHHNVHFDLDENAFITGVISTVKFASCFLNI